jgi:hypothetical protein
LSQPLRYDYEESQRVLSNSITQNDKERAIFKQKLEALLAFDAQSPGYFSGVGESEALLNEGLTLLGGDPATGKVGAGSWNGQGFTPIMSDWQQRVNDQWSKRVERQEQARAAEFEQAVQGRTYQRVQLASGAYQWLWVKDSGKITQEDLQFNEKYADYLAILNAPEENMVDEYYQNMLEELRTGINTKTGKPLTTLEKAQRWSAVASFVAVLAIGSYYSVKGLTGTKTTAKQPKSTTKATGPKAKLPSDTTQGRQLKVKKADIPKGKNRSIAAPKKANEAKVPNVEIKKPLGKNIKKHISKHDYESFKKQADYLTDSQLAQKLEKNSFFNPAWSTSDMNKYVEIAYNDLLAQGKTGKHVYEIAGEKITIVIKNDGGLDTAFGSHKLTVNDFRK